MDISSFLVWLAGGGSLVAASWVLGQFSWYSNMIEKTKKFVFFGLAVLFGGGSYAVSQYVPVATLSAIAPYFLIVAFVFSAVFLNQAAMKFSEMAKSLKILSMKKQGK
jgi:hypothetical protein